MPLPAALPLPAGGSPAPPIEKVLIV